MPSEPMAMTLTSEGLAMILVALSEFGVSTIYHIILPGLADTILKPIGGIKLNSKARGNKTLNTAILLAFRISLLVLKDKLLDKLPSLTSFSIIRGCEQSQLLFTYKPLTAYFHPRWTAQPEKPPQRFLMYAYLPGCFTHIYVVLEIKHCCCFKQLQLYPNALPLSNESPSQAAKTGLFIPVNVQLYRSLLVLMYYLMYDQNLF